MRLTIARIALYVALSLWATSVGAENPAEPSQPSSKGQYSPSEIAKQLHNPLSNLREVIFQLDVLPNVGPNEKTEWTTTIQPVWPFPLVADWKLVTYSIIPVVSQPGLTPGADRTNGLGDSTFFGYLVPPNEGKIIWGFGPALQVPTHTNADLGIDKWAAGPALIVGVQPGNWSIFGLLDNIWSFAGSDGEDINLLNFQYQAVRLFPKDWFFITNWVVEADWEAKSGDGIVRANSFTLPKHQNRISRPLIFLHFSGAI